MCELRPTIEKLPRKVEFISCRVEVRGSRLANRRFSTKVNGTIIVRNSRCVSRIVALYRLCAIR